MFSCQTEFRGGGAHRRGPWIGDATWDPAGKPFVDGDIRWPNAEISLAIEGAERVVRANNLPNHPTGQFPIAADDDAYAYDRNPNAIAPQAIVLRLPAIPAASGRPNCVPMGMIGFALTGAAIFNALDAQGRDAPAHEIQDACGGHPERRGQYHYHDRSACMEDARSQPGGHSDLVGYAIDGFGIFGLAGADGAEITNADLDECHGHSHEMVWDGQRRDIYHYHLSREYPYTIGCFRGTVQLAAQAGPRRRGARR